MLLYLLPLGLYQLNLLWHLGLNHTTSLVEPIFARGRFAGNGSDGNENRGEHNGICVITN